MINNKEKIAVVFGVRNDLSIAFQVAIKLRESGAKVILAYQKENLAVVSKLIQENNFDSSCSGEVDVTSEESIERFFKKIGDHFKKIDYIFHSVAFASPKIISMSKLLSNSTEEFDYLNIPFEDLMESINIGAYSLIRIARCSRGFLNKNASIVTVTFRAANRVIPQYGGMAIVKAALENIVIYLAQSLSKYDVRVNAISAGFVMTTSSAGIKNIRKMREQNSLNSPLGEIDSSHVAQAAMFYMSDMSLKNTGNTHYVDGGVNIVELKGRE